MTEPIVSLSCPACGTGTNIYGQPFGTHEAVVFHVAAKILLGDMEHLMWIARRAPELDLTGWHQRPYNWGTIRGLAKLIYASVERALDEGLANRRAVPESRVVDMARELNRILDAIDSEGQQQGETVTRRIGRLSKTGLVPRYVAALMRAIREYRNLIEHEHKEFSEADILAIRGAWKVIHEWASAQEIEHRTFDDF